MQQLTNLRVSVYSKTLNADLKFTARRGVSARQITNHESRVCFIGLNPAIYTWTRLYFTQIL